MVEMNLKTGSRRSNWSSQDDSSRSNPEGIRWGILSRPHVWQPPTDVYETEDVLVVRVEIAGMHESDFTVSIEDRLLSVRGIRPDTSERRAYHQMEILFGEFAIEVELPYAIVPEKIEAVYKDGFLRIVLPKARPQQIRVE